MSEQQKSDDPKEPLITEQEKELLSEEQPRAAEAILPSHKTDAQETEWIPGERLELLRIPPPTIWPATLALGATGIAFGVVTHWILSLAGLFLFLLGAAGWIEDLRSDVLQR